jgi:hypothetical protein
MSDDPIRAAAPRRDLLKAALGGAAFVGSSLVAARASAASKMGQKLVHYQATPKGSARCQTCSQFLPAPACKLVDDPITPTGWCLLYAAKA